MPAPRFATVTQRYQAHTRTAERVTPDRVPFGRAGATLLAAYAVLSLAWHALTGQWLGGAPYCYTALILGTSLWLADGQRRLAARLCRELHNHEAQHDLGEVMRVLAE